MENVMNNPMKVDVLIDIVDLGVMGILMQKTFEGKAIEYLSNSIKVANSIKLLKINILIKTFRIHSNPINLLKMEIPIQLVKNVYHESTLKTCEVITIE